MRKKKSKLTKLKETADKLWSLWVRKRDGKCILCGSTKKLQAHHAIITKHRSNRTRWFVANGVTLCWSCHWHKVRINADLDTLLRVCEAAKIVNTDILRLRAAALEKNMTDKETTAFLEKYIMEMRYELNGGTIPF